MVKRRTNPYFLSGGEAARESTRTTELVRSIAGIDPSRRDVRCNVSTHHFGDQSAHRHKQRTTRIVGETDNFVLQFDYKNKVIEMYGKDFFVGRLFKLRLNVGDSKTISNYLSIARNIMANSQVKRIGEISKFAVDSDGNQRLVILSEKTDRDFPIKLGFNETEITAIIDLLAKARSLF